MQSRNTDEKGIEFSKLRNIINIIIFFIFLLYLQKGSKILAKRPRGHTAT